MHGCSSGSALLVNAEVDSMGGVVDGGVGTGLKTSPRRAAIEKAQAELSQEYDVREERRRELEFLEKGGNPLDFKFGNAASVSVQSTSLTDQNPEQFVTSEAKGSFALTASPHGDSVDSSGRPGIPTVSEPNTADNLLLFDGDHDLPEADRKPIHPRRRDNIARSEQSSQIDGAQNAKESEDSAIVRPYARRNRSRSNREGARSNAIDAAQNRGGQGSAFPACVGSGNAKVQINEKNNQKVQNTPAISNLKSASSNGDLTPGAVASDNQLDAELDGAHVTEIIGLTKASLHEIELDAVPPKQLNDTHHNQSSQVDSQKTPDMVTREFDSGDKDQMVSTNVHCATTVTTEKETTTQLNGYIDARENKSTLNEVENRNAVVIAKGLDSQSSCNQSSLGLDVHKDSDICTGTRNVGANGIFIGKTANAEETPNENGATPARDVNEIETVNDAAAIRDNHSTVSQNQSGTLGAEKNSEYVHENSSEFRKEVNIPPNNEGVHLNDHMLSETDGEADAISNNNSSLRENSTRRCQESLGVSMHELPEPGLSTKKSAAAPDIQTAAIDSSKVSDKAHEDFILEEARIIQAKHKRIAELSVRSMPPENRRKSHWDFVLEEMAWLANDFAQERIWKITAAAQLCHRVAFATRSRFEQQYQHLKLKEIAHVLAKAVMQFWHSAEEPIKEQEIDSPRKDSASTLQGYAVRFLKYNSSLGLRSKVEAPATPDRVSDVGIQEMSWQDHLTEESLFYTVSSGAMETYRKSIEAHLVHYEKTGSSMQEEVETSTYEAGAEYGFQENMYAEDEGETSTYYMPGAFEGTKPLKSTQKKRKHLASYPRSHETGAELPYGQSTTMSQQSMLMAKRPASLNVGAIPTKRMRTASRQRVVTPNANVQVQVKTDASSGDTNSFQDDQSMHGGSQFQKSMEVESVGDFDKHLAYDCVETSIKPKKKKKAKHLGSAYDQGWQMDSSTLNEQRDYPKKRPESHFDSNGTSGLYMQNNAKKPKISKHLLENTFENTATMAGSNPSPVASQNNMSNTTKFIKLIGGRDRGRKSKSLKMTVGQPGSGSPWTLFEDQALVVLVHDMGPNWELISDAINSTLHFKCIFRKSKDCKERHKFLMDKSAGDGADSAEDSGSSQPYPSTLPGIPKLVSVLKQGSARQLFQRLQEPLEEDTIKSHFDKIIKIGQKQHSRWNQNEIQDLKQIAPVHNSHVMALSQVCPNNLNGVLLTPLDLCDANSSNQDILPFGCQGSHNSGLPNSNQGGAAPILPSSGANSSLPGSPGVVLGTNLPSSPGALNASVRDGRYSAPPRASSLSVEEQQRMQQYNHVSGRNMQQSSLPVSGALSGTDRGVRMLPGGNGVGMISGMNRNMPMSRPGYQGINSPSMLHSGSMLSSSMVGMPGSSTMHSGAASGQGNSMIRPREALHMMRPGHNPEHQRQMMVPELQMQGTSQGMTPFNGLSAGFPNQTTAPPVSSYPGHPHQHQVSQQQSHGLNSPHHPHLQGPNHVTGSQQAFALRLAKERHMHQRYVQQQQQQPQPQQFSGSNALMPHVQPQTHLSVSSTLPNSSQIQSPAPSQSVSMSPLTPSSPMTPISAQHPQKHHLPPHGLSRSTGAMTNQMGKQRQRQPQQQHLQQASRQHPQQRQHLPSHQQAKLLKGVGRGLVQNLPVDPLNGLSVPPGGQPLEKGEQIMQMMQGQGAYSGPGLNSMQQPKPMGPQSSNHSQLQPKLVSSSAPPPTKQHQQIPAHPDNNVQGQVPVAPSGQVLSSSLHQVVPPAVMGPNHQQPQPHQKQVNQTQQSVQRIMQQNRQANSEPPGKPQNDTGQFEQQGMNNTNPVGASMAVPQSCVDSSAAVSVPSTAASQRKPSEHVYDSNLPNSTVQASSERSQSLTNSSGTEPTLPVSQGAGPTRQSSGSLPSHVHNVGAQWQPSQQQPPPQPPQPHQALPATPQQFVQQELQQQQPEQKSLTTQQPLPQQQVPHLQTGQGMYLRPSNSKPE